MKKTRPYIACLIPMSRTWPALSENAADSSGSRPKSLTSSAPDTLNRSVIVVPMPALSCMASRVMTCSRRPTQRAGSRNSGVSSSAQRVICQDRNSMVATTSTRPMTLETTEDSVEVNACWAPITSVLSRLTSAPVWVRVKKATGIRWTWANTLVRRS